MVSHPPVEPPKSAARPALADAAKLFFDFRNQFVVDGIAVGAEVGGIHGVRIVIVRIGVLNEEHDHSRKFACAPILKKLILRLCARELAALQIRDGRLRLEKCNRAGNGLARPAAGNARWEGLPAFGKNNDRAEIHRLPPEFVRSWL